VATAPEWCEAKHNLGRACFGLGRSDEALSLFAEASLGVRVELPLRAIAVAAPGAPSSTQRGILAARQAWAQRFLPQRGRPAPAHRPHGEPLRIGYISAFFQTNNWMKPVWGLINEHDRSRVEVHLFSDAPASAIEHGYRAHANDRFYDVTNLSNEAAAEIVAAADIDILVDLNGYSAPRRLGLIALRPAPLIVGWFNHFATTGIAAYDYLIGDATVIPPEEECFYSESILRVPGSYLAFSVEYPVPPVAPSPRRANRATTFGCLAPQYKINDRVIDAWSAILRAVPGSLLVLRNTALNAAETRRFVRDRFAERSIDATRLRLYGRAEHYAFLETYDAIDIALDTFPYNGGTTTSEALWQGVPVVTFWGDRWASRTSASLLRAGDLSAFVAADLAAYVALASRLGNAPEMPERLAELRTSMRSRLRACAVCDTAGLARSLEGIYERLARDRLPFPAASFLAE
jgi:predicted O-linked N-acetylglucosamine transferase (SPINDLY family)